MALVSVNFFLIFTGLVIVYFTIPKKLQWIILLIFSYIFYSLISKQLPFFLLISTAITYCSTVLMEKMKPYKKPICIASIVFIIGMLAVFKYSNQIISVIAQRIPSFGGGWDSEKFSFLIPLGISFYSFQSLGYILDVYRKKVKPEKNFFKTALFISFFSQIIEGPIGRFDILSPQLYSEHRFSFERLKINVFLLLWGIIKKLVIADNLAPMITEIRDNYSDYSGFQILISILFFGLQLYADFSGYMDIVTGLSGILGIEIAQNFKRPYFSVNVTEFWRRWHISLCTWFRDYVFYSIFMSKCLTKLSKKLRKSGYKKTAKKLPIYISTFIVWLLTGLWHAANGPEILWGISNGFIMICALQFKAFYEKINKCLHICNDLKGVYYLRIIRTFILMTVLNYASEFASIREVRNIFVRIVTNFAPVSLSLSYLFPKLIDAGLATLAVVLLFCFLLIAFDFYEEKHGSVIKLISKKSWIFQIVLLIVTIFIVGVFGNVVSNSVGGFMYAQY